MERVNEGILSRSWKLKIHVASRLIWVASGIALVSTKSPDCRNNGGLVMQAGNVQIPYK
jgi:hypothetical protein